MNELDNMTGLDPVDQTLTAEVSEEASGERLDRFLASAFPEHSRSRLKSLIQNGHVANEGGTITDPSYRVKPEETLRLEIPESAPAEPQPENIPLKVVYEDAYLLVIDKPSGLVVHPAPGSETGTLVNALLYHCGDSLSGIGGVRRPGIVHRLDKDTSGLMVVAKTDAAHKGLAQQFEDHSLERAYQALVWGMPNPREGEIEGNIGRNPHDRKKMAVVNRGGKYALTRYRVIQPLNTFAALVECRLATGRTHQIRVHMSSIGNPVIADPLYGKGDHRWLKKAGEEVKQAVKNLQGQALHAYLIGFKHPISGKTLRFEGVIPCEINELIEKIKKF